MEARATAKQLHQRFFFWLSITIFGVGSLMLSSVCWILLHLPRPQRFQPRVRRVIYKLLRFWYWYTQKSGMVRIEWEEPERLQQMRGQIVVANHPNLLDACWLLAHAPHAICYFKAGLKKNTFLSATARAAGYISNDSGIRGFHEAVTKLHEGTTLIVFPEGTRTVTPPLNPIRQGFALIAAHAAVPIQVVAISSDTKLFTKGNFFTFGKLPMHFRIRFGPTIRPGGGRNPRQLAQEVEDALRSELEAMARQQ